MKKVVKLKESELIDLIKKAVNEQHEEPTSEVLEDYLKNGTLYINKEIMIVDNDKVHVYQTDNVKAPDVKYKSIKHKMVLNLYNYNCLRSDTFTIKSA